MVVVVGVVACVVAAYGLFCRGFNSRNGEEMETVVSIAKWSEETFGERATLKGQKLKFEDEKVEWLSSGRADIMELADLAIVASSIARFSVVEAMTYFSFIDVELALSGFTAQDLERAINEKQAINRKRKWNFNGNNWQHKE